MKVTGQQIVNGALTALGILEQSGSPSVSDSTDALGELNVMWDAWSIDENLIYAVVPQRFPWTAANQFNTIGPGAALNTQLPSRIYGARWVTATGGAISSSAIDQAGLGYAVNDTGVVLGSSGTPATYAVTAVGAQGKVTAATISAGTGYAAGAGYSTATGGAQPGAGSGLTIDITAVSAGGTLRTPLAVVEATEYYAHRDTSASALVPDEIYPDYNPDAAGFARIYSFPVPSAAGVLELETGAPFLAWTLGGAYNLPAGFQDDIQYALAWRLLPRYGAAVAQQVAEVIRELGMKAEARIIAANAANRQKPPAPPAGGGGPGQSPVTPPAVSQFRGMQPQA